MTRIPIHSGIRQKLPVDRIIPNGITGPPVNILSRRVWLPTRPFRTRLYRNFQVIFARETPALLLYYPVYTYAVDQRMQGVQGAPLFESADRFLMGLQAGI